MQFICVRICFRIGRCAVFGFLVLLIQFVMLWLDRLFLRNRLGWMYITQNGLTFPLFGRDVLVTFHKSLFSAFITEDCFSFFLFDLGWTINSGLFVEFYCPGELFVQWKCLGALLVLCMVCVMCASGGACFLIVGQKPNGSINQQCNHAQCNNVTMQTMQLRQCIAVSHTASFAHLH